MFMLASEAMPLGNSIHVKISSDIRLILKNRICNSHLFEKKTSLLTLLTAMMTAINKGNLLVLTSIWGVFGAGTGCDIWPQLRPPSD